MKTAMQEAIKEIADLWSSPSDRPNYTQIFKVLESKLELEKELIIKAHNNAVSSPYTDLWIFPTQGKEITKGEKYYNENYNQNK